MKLTKSLTSEVTVIGRSTHCILRQRFLVKNSDFPVEGMQQRWAHLQLVHAPFRYHLVPAVVGILQVFPQHGPIFRIRLEN